MTNQTPTEILRDQHRNILKVADVLEEVLSNEPEPGAFDYEAIGQCVSFIRLYADALHHGKEEDLLFPELVRQGMSREAGPIAVNMSRGEPTPGPWPTPSAPRAQATSRPSVDS